MCRRDLGFGIVGAHEVGSIGLLEALARAFRELLIIVEDAAGGIGGQVHALHVAQIRQVEHAQDVNADGLDLHQHSRDLGGAAQ